MYDEWVRAAGARALPEGWRDAPDALEVLSETGLMPLAQELGAASASSSPEANGSEKGEGARGAGGAEKEVGPLRQASEAPPEYRLLHTLSVCPRARSLRLFAEVRPGQALQLMRTDVHKLAARIGNVATRLLDDSGLRPEQLCGGLSILCAGLMAQLDRQGLMPVVAEELAEAVHWAPTLGLVTLGEQGSFAAGKSAHGNLMFSTVLFTNVRLVGQGGLPCSPASKQQRPRGFSMRRADSSTESIKLEARSQSRQ